MKTWIPKSSQRAGILITAADEYWTLAWEMRSLWKLENINYLIYASTR
jgi:hypothetical protein